MINYHCPYELTKSPEDSGYDLRYWPTDYDASNPDHKHHQVYLSLTNGIFTTQGGIFSTGLRLQIPTGWEAQIRPRSGLAKDHGITVLNSPGTIDAGYEGEVCVLLVKLFGNDFVIKPNMRIAQLVFAQVAGLPLTRSEKPLEKRSLRGDGGFGSTGVD